MFLKKLEIMGFKSFAERISIDFVKGINTVVGPNGSGKSNIIDAVRWVLGEQSAKSLRGSKMEDIIFAGSESRKPLNFAEVTLLLDNSDQRITMDFHEIAVTRRVYRTGDSEFFINKKSCRLKDVIDLFMDSGLGKEAFSIISQGKVEEILSSKPEERRSIFEEASGVLKYKLRKKKAQAKLTEADDNLHRVEDILYELENQVEPLREQASIAKEYLEQRKQLDEKEISLLICEIQSFHEKWQQAKLKLEELEEIELQSNTEVVGLESNVTELREKLQVLDESIDSLQEVLLCASQELEKLEGQRELLFERRNNAHGKRDEYEARLHELKQLLSQNELKQKELQREEHTLNENQKENEIQLAKQNERLQMLQKGIENELDDAKAEYIESYNSYTQVSHEERTLREQLQRDDEQRERVKLQMNQYDAQLKEKEDQLSTLVTEHDKTARVIAVEQAEYKTLTDEMKRLSSDLESKRNEREQGERLLHGLQSRLQVIEEMKDDFAGFYQGVKEVLKHRNERLPGVVGAVAELITVPKDYEVALEIALGANMQNVVVQNEESARRSIEFLKSNRLGRATFLPMNVISSRTLPQDVIATLQQQEQFVGIASSLVQCESTYVRVIQHLIGNVIIAKTLVGANALARLVHHRYRIVTLDGEVVHPGGSMTGGATRTQSAGLLSRNREQEEITEKIADLQRVLQQLKQSNDATRELYEQHLERHHELHELLEGKTTKLQSYEASIKQVQYELSLLTEQSSTLRIQQEMKWNEQENLSERVLKCKKKSEALKHDVEKWKEKIDELQKMKEQEDEWKQQTQEQVTEYRLKEARLRERLTALEEHVQRLRDESTKLADEKTLLQERIHGLFTNLSTFHVSEQELDQMLKKQSTERETTLTLISQRREQRLQFHSEMEQLDVALREWKRKQKQIQQAKTDEEVRSTRMDVELKNRLEQLSEKFQLSFEGACLQYGETHEVEKVRRDIRLLKRSIEELGAVNIGAIEEYDRVKERYEFLTEQQRDLLQAKETLLQVIEEMDEEMIRRFQMTFTSIQSQFCGVFQELFGGGQADLLLTDPSDLLNTGIEIVAQPPGKKLQHLSLLSGGERALTAIALLFSILKVRPVPFCILDEVEAALDEANVFRYAQYLRKFSHETQFIVITHRKGTMEESDVLYGVTMQESGVSGIVSVRLEDRSVLDSSVK